MRGAVIPTLLAISLGASCTQRLMLETPDAGDVMDAASEKSGATPDAAGDAGGDAGSDGPGSNDHMGCNVNRVPVGREIPSVDVMLVVGRDASMASNFDWGTRMSVTGAAISDVVSSFQAGVQFGYVEYPAIDGCGPGVCCVSGPAIPPAPNTKDFITGALACGNQSCTAASDARPIDAAIKLAAGAFFSPAPPFTNQYIVLIADGPPYCYGNDTGQSCSDARKAVQGATNQKIATYVIGVGGGVEQDDCLRMLASAGGTGGTPSPVLPGRDGKSLGNSLYGAVGSAAASRCVIDLTESVFDPGRVQLQINKAEIPFDQAHVNGWAFRQGSGSMTIDVFGDSCRLLQTTSDKDITVWQGCPPCMPGAPDCR